MPEPKIIDLSHWNTIPESLAPARASGILGIIHKITEGAGLIDDKARARFALARDAGMLWGVYHFLRPGNMTAQAEFFVEQARAIDGGDRNTIFAADHEDEKVGIGQLVEFLDAVEHLTLRTPLIYSGHVLKDQIGAGPASSNLTRFPLWLAQYGPEPKLPPGFDAYWLWQYTDQGNVPGINPPTDLNAYPGSDAELVADWTGAAPAPEPEPLTVMIDIYQPPGVVLNIRVNGQPLT